MINGSRLRTLRKRHKITAEELGNVIGVSGQQVLRYETEQNDMPTDTLIKLSEFFQVSADYLLGRADNPKPYEYRARMLTWSIDTTSLLNNFEPEHIARVIHAFGLHVRLEPEAVTVSNLLKDHPPEKIGRLLSSLGLQGAVSIDTPESPESDS